MKTGDPTENGCPTVLMLLTNAYPPDPRVRQEALALAAMGCRIQLLAWDRDLAFPASEIVEGIEVERVHLPSTHGRGATQLFYYAALYGKLLLRGWKTRFDAVHCHDLDTLPIGFVLGKLKRKPIVFDSHENFTEMLEGSVNPVIRRILLWLEDFLIRRIDLLITVGEKLRRHFQERGASRSVVIGNWKRRSEFARTKEQNLATRRSLSIPDGAFTIVCITQLLADRKLEELLDAVDQSPDVHLILGGNGVLEPLVRRRAAANSRIHFAGFVNSQQIAAYTCAADVVYYGFDPQNPNARYSAPNKLFEALAAGRPLISGDFGEIAEVVRAARCGIILPHYSAATIQQAIESLRTDTDLYHSLARAAFECGSGPLNWDTAEHTLHEQYSLLLSRQLTPPQASLQQCHSTAVRT